jgi:hypothetical protein
MSKLLVVPLVTALALACHMAKASVITVSPMKEWTSGINGFAQQIKAAGNGIGPSGSVQVVAQLNELYDLPDEEPDTRLTSAVLTFTETVSKGGNPYGLGLYGVGPIKYTPNLLTGDLWYSRNPNNVLLGQLPPDFGIRVVHQVDITDYLNSVYSTSDPLGFVVRSMHPAKDYSPDYATFGVQSLSLTFSPNTPATPPAPATPPNEVPEPDGRAVFASGVALLGCSLRLRRKTGR